MLVNFVRVGEYVAVKGGLEVLDRGNVLFILRGLSFATGIIGS